MESVKGSELVEEIRVEAIASLQDTQGCQWLIFNILEDVSGQPLRSVEQM